MKHWVKAGIAAVLLAGAAYSKDIPFKGWRLAATLGLSTLTFMTTVFELKPDARINRIRQADLDSRVKTLLADAERAAKGKRLPFRVNMMARRRTWWGLPVLKMVYGYNMERGDGDYGYTWIWRHGLCWVAFSSGKRQFKAKDGGGAPKVRMSKADRRATAEVTAVLSFPVRSAHRKDSDPLPQDVKAVLNVDALNDGAAKQLAVFWDEMEKNGTHSLVELAAYAGLYC